MPVRDSYVNDFHMKCCKGDSTKSEALLRKGEILPQYQSKQGAFIGCIDFLGGNLSVSRLNILFF